MEGWDVEEPGQCAQRTDWFSSSKNALQRSLSCEERTLNRGLPCSRQSRPVCGACWEARKLLRLEPSNHGRYWSEVSKVSCWVQLVWALKCHPGNTRLHTEDSAGWPLKSLDLVTNTGDLWQPLMTNPALWRVNKGGGWLVASLTPSNHLGSSAYPCHSPVTLILGFSRVHHKM